MSAKNEIIARIREALRVEAPLPGHHGEHAPAHPHQPDKFSQWLPPVSENQDDQLALFAKNSDELKTEFHLLESTADLPARLRDFAQQNGWKRVATHVGELTDLAVPAIGLPTLKTDGGYVIAELEQCDAGISECDVLVAQTGGILVTNRSAGGRALSVLPPHGSQGDLHLAGFSRGPDQAPAQLCASST